MKDWKSCERRIAELLGDQRSPVSVRARDDCTVIAHDQLSIDFKSRKRLQGWLEEALRQAEASTRDRQMHIAVSHQGGRRYADCLVVLRLKNFISYVKEDMT